MNCEKNTIYKTGWYNSVSRCISNYGAAIIFHPGLSAAWRKNSTTLKLSSLTGANCEKCCCTFDDVSCDSLLRSATRQHVSSRGSDASEAPTMMSVTASNVTRLVHVLCLEWPSHQLETVFGLI